MCVFGLRKPTFSAKRDKWSPKCLTFCFYFFPYTSFHTCEEMLLKTQHLTSWYVGLLYLQIVPNGLGANWIGVGGWKGALQEFNIFNIKKMTDLFLLSLFSCLPNLEQLLFVLFRSKMSHTCMSLKGRCYKKSYFLFGNTARERRWK